MYILYTYTSSIMTMIESYTTRMYVCITVFTVSFFRVTAAIPSQRSASYPRKIAPRRMAMSERVPITHVSTSAVEYR